MKKVILFLTVLILLSCNNDKAKTILAEQQNQDVLEAKNIDLVKQLLNAADNNNIAFLNEISDPEYKYYLPSNAAPLNLEQHIKFWSSVNEAFPNLVHEIQEIYSIDDTVVARVLVKGKHLKEFAGIPPTNKTVEVSQIFICRIKNNKLIEFREEADLLGLYQQLGLELKMKE